MLLAAFVCLPACSYSVHGKGWEFLRVKDQTQVAVVSLLNIAASAVRMGPRFAQAVMDGTAMAICKHYKDPFSLVVSWWWCWGVWCCLISHHGAA